ncbi:hypothetical protein GF415_01030 [Candidatus Micrarchaeota archaeon]|nr:hypothetical protein [Candidatus Micrarchaeota archaeon]
MGKKAIAKKCVGTKELPAGNGLRPRTRMEEYEKEVREVFAAVSAGIKGLWRLNEGNVDIRDARQMTPLMAAAKNGKCSVVEELLKELDADPKLEDMDGNTALHHAILNGNRTTAKILMKNGANPDLINKGGKTPLHLAIINEDRASAKTLVENGADWEAELVLAVRQRRKMVVDRITEIVGTEQASPVIEESRKKPPLFSTAVENVDDTGNAVYELGLQELAKKGEPGSGP